jgi:predicted PurR-regulated permease PerM
MSRRENALPLISEQPGPRQDKFRGNAHSAVLFAAGIFLVLALAWKLAKELEIIYVSALFAIVLMPIVFWIMKLDIRGWHPPRGLAIVLLVAMGVFGITLFFTIGLPPVLRDITSFSEDLPARIPSIASKLDHLPIVDRMGVNAIASRVENAATATATYLISSLPLWITHLFDILTTAFLCIYFMLEGEYAYRFFLSLFHPEQRYRIDATLQKAELKMSKWLLGQGLLMLILGVSSTIVFGILHVRYFVLLGVLMGLFNIIPIAGGIITIILAAGVAAIDSWPKMFGVLIFYGIYVNIENAYLIPRIMKSSVDLMGLTVLVALLIGTALAGVVGALVAVPTAALVTVILNEYAVQREW